MFSATCLIFAAFFLPSPASVPSMMTTQPSTQPTLEMTIDVSQAPDLSDFAERAKAACEKMYPSFCSDLASDDFVPPTKVLLEFDPAYKGVAATDGTHIHCALDYFRKHPGDVGAIVHELVHVVQQYPKYDPVWLVEGIADYERFFKFEPLSNRPHPSAAHARYQDGYRTAAAFLDWAQSTYDPQLVAKLNTACRETHDVNAVFQQSTGKSLAELWTEYAKTLK